MTTGSCRACWSTSRAPAAWAGVSPPSCHVPSSPLPCFVRFSFLLAILLLRSCVLRTALSLCDTSSAHGPSGACSLVSSKIGISPSHWPMDDAASLCAFCPGWSEETRLLADHPKCCVRSLHAADPYPHPPQVRPRGGAVLGLHVDDAPCAASPSARRPPRSRCGVPARMPCMLSRLEEKCYLVRHGFTRVPTTKDLWAGQPCPRVPPACWDPLCTG